MFCKCLTADPIGPHQCGNPGRWEGGTCARGSMRLRCGTGERDRSESAMTKCEVQAANHKKSCNHSQYCIVTSNGDMKLFIQHLK